MLACRRCCPVSGPPQRLSESIRSPSKERHDAQVASAGGRPDMPRKLVTAQTGRPAHEDKEIATDSIVSADNCPQLDSTSLNPRVRWCESRCCKTEPRLSGYAAAFQNRHARCRIASNSRIAIRNYPAATRRSNRARSTPASIARCAARRWSCRVFYTLAVIDGAIWAQAHRRRPRHFR